MFKIKQKDIERFWSKVKKTKNCWNFFGAFTRDGYGQLGIDGQMRRAHRVSWIIHKGIIPKSTYVLHKCDKRNCVNIKHLYLGTQLDNMRDMVERKRNSDNNGEKNPRAILKNSDVLRIRKIYSRGKTKQKELAKKFNVDQVTISHILRKYTWKNLC